MALCDFHGLPCPVGIFCRARRHEEADDTEWSRVAWPPTLGSTDHSVFQLPYQLPQFENWVRYYNIIMEKRHGELGTGTRSDWTIQALPSVP